MGVRIHQLARELDLESKELKAILHAHGIKIASHLSSIHEDIAENIRREVRARKAATRPSEPTRASKSKSASTAAEAKPAGSGAKPSSTPTPTPEKPAAPPKTRRGPVIIRPKSPPPTKERGPERVRSKADNGRDSGTSTPAPMDAPPKPAEGKGRRRVRVFPGDSQFRDGFPERTRPRGPLHTHRPGRKPRGKRTREGFRSQRDTLSPDRPSEVRVEIPITLKELSSAIGVKVNLIMAQLIGHGQLNVNSYLTRELIELISEKFQVKIDADEKPSIDSSLTDLETREEPEELLAPRAPVVTFLGHVDHGKTTLLDKIRETRVVMGEAGGITQHLSAYRVDQGEKHVVFIDTPGHEAFTEMRARGANVTDVVVLIVAADDGVMQQTEEAIQHARAANVPIVVAINKIDKANSNVPRTKEQLANLGLSPPEWGGKTEMVELSALNGDGIDDLLEILSLETEILDLMANPTKGAIGTVLDAKATPGRGSVVTVLVQEGTLRPGDPVVCGPGWGRVRHLQTTTGIPIESAAPSTPVEVTGLDELPEAGDRFYVLENLSATKEIAQDRKRRKREAERATRQHVSLEGLFEHISKGKAKEVNLIIKADVKGTLEALRKELLDLATDEVGVAIKLAGVGEITEADVTLADASDAIVIGFHVVPGVAARALADERNVEIRQYQVIYQLIEDVKLALEGLLEPELYEEIQSNVEIREIFRSSRLGNIAGCYVRSGTIRREDPVRLIRDGSPIYQGQLDSLKRFKDDAAEVKEGFECGLRIQGYNDVKIGDVVESYKILKKIRTFADTKSDKK